MKPFSTPNLQLPEGVPIRVYSVPSWFFSAPLCLRGSTLQKAPHLELRTWLGFSFHLLLRPFEVAFRVFRVFGGSTFWLFSVMIILKFVLALPNQSTILQA